MVDGNTFGAMDWFRFISTVAWLAIFVNWPQITLAVTLLIVGGMFIAFNAMVFWSSVIRKEHFPSVAPIVGGISAAAGIAILPLAGSWKWAWIALVIDWGGLPIFLVWCVARFKP